MAKQNPVPKNGDLRIWWIPQLGSGSAFYQSVNSIREARLVLNTLTKYDDFQLQNKIKPDYANAGGLEVYDTAMADDDGNCWVDWSNENGDDVDDVDDDGNSPEDAG